MGILKILGSIGFTFNLALKHFKLINNYIVKSDEENIELLLENEKDKVKFQQAIDEMFKEGRQSAEVEINNKNITISM